MMPLVPLSKLLLGVLLGGILLSAGATPAAAQQTIDVETVASGLNGALQVAHVPGDRDRIFVVEQPGYIRIIENGTLLPTPFLDLSATTGAFGERGLLGLAFHPDYANNGYFYVNRTPVGSGTEIERYTVSASNPNQADPNSALTILTIAQPFSNHNGGWLAFGPDGFLYIGTGDGGSAGDPGNRAQDGQELLGKMLRLDVDNPSGGNNYGIPASNPFVGNANVLDEIWALGLRNPWRCAFDSETGDLWIADVGQNAWEEVDFEPAGMGGLNYGWRIMEGNHCYNPPTGCNQSGLELPIHEYAHSFNPVRCSITGGEVYRGRNMADMHGRYFFSDYCSGELWSMREDNGVKVDFVDHSNEVGALGGVVGFGLDADGEMYVCNGSTVRRIVPAGMVMQVPHLQAGVSDTVRVDGGIANRNIALAWSVSGLGMTPVPPAGVVLSLADPQPGALATTNGAGTAVISVTPPPSALDRTVWFQALQSGLTSNVVVETVE